MLGRLLGIAFLVTFGTGLFSQYLQNPFDWMRFPTRPSWLYQVNQGVHITAGILCFPLLLGKLWVVFPNLFQFPPVKGFKNFLERASVALFVGASLLQIFTGLLNTYQFVPFPFYFRQTHFALSFVIIGSLAIHIAVKLPIIARYWTKKRTAAAGGEGELEVFVEPDTRATHLPPLPGLTGRVMSYIDSAPRSPAAVSRRGFLTAIGLSSVTVVALTSGQSFAPLDAVNLFAPRKKGFGPQGVPVNRTSAEANVGQRANDPNWTLILRNGAATVALTRAELLAMPQVTASLPIACVQGWSQQATWRGVRVRELAALVGANSESSLRITSLEQQGPYIVTQMGREYVQDPDTLVALELNGQTLDIEHGYPARVIAPARPGVLQTKWLSSLEVI